MDFIGIFCEVNRIRLNDNVQSAVQSPIPIRWKYERDDDDRPMRRDQGYGQPGRDFRRNEGQGKGRKQPAPPVLGKPGKGQGEGGKTKAYEAADLKSPQNQKGKPSNDAPKQDVKSANKKAATNVEAPASTTAAVSSLKDTVYWRCGPFPPNSRAARAAKGKVKLGSKGLRKLTQLDGKKFDTHPPVLKSSLEVLAHSLSFLSSIERWKLRSASSAFALAFQMDEAWTTATLQPTYEFQGPWIPREHLPLQLDVMQKHKDALQSISISGFDGLQFAILQTYTSLVDLKVHSSGGCIGLTSVPKSVRKLHLEFCTLKGDARAQLDAFKDTHPESNVFLLKCSDEKLLEGHSEKGKPFLINLQLVGGVVKELE